MSKPPSAASPSSPPPPPPPPRQPPRQSLRSIPPLVLLSFAVIHSQVYWLYSVIYHLYQTLPDRTVDLDETVRNALTRRSGRARAFSDPQQTSSVALQRRQTTTSSVNQPNSSAHRGRPRSTTISATTVDADAPLRRQQWVQHVHACLDEQESLGYSSDGFKRGSTQTIIADERLGRTRPPRWWQRTKRHLTRQDKEDEPDGSSNNSNPHLASTLSLPANALSSSTTTTVASTSLDSSTTTNTTANSLLALAVTNNSLSQNIQSVSPSSCDLQHHHDITAITNPSITNQSTAHPTPLAASQSSHTTSASSSSMSSTILSTTIPKRSLDSQRAAISSQQQQQIKQQRRPLAKIRSVFVKSQIEPEKARASQLEPKRKTILGIPSRWSSSTNSDSTPPREQRQQVDNKMSTKSKKRQSVRIKEPQSTTPPPPPPPSTTITNNTPATSSPLAQQQCDLIASPPPSTKKRLFSSLPIWKRKSVDT